MKQQGNGRVVVITGASSGIGRATALRFAEAGDTVVVAARRKSLLKEVVDQVEDRGSQALAVDTDVSDEDSIEKLAQSAVKKFGRIDVWVNDAGVSVVGKFDEIPLEEHRQVIETNLNGTIYGAHAALRQFKKQDRGILINISSVLGKVTQPYMSSYSASKHAVRALSACIRQELWLDEQEDIHVCTVFPQSVDTPFFENEANRSGYKVKPAPPIVEPEQVAEVIFGLADSPQDEAHVGKMGKVMSMQNKVARKMTEKQMSIMTDRKHLDKSTKVKGHSGNLFRGSRSNEGEIHGGWKNGSSKKKPITALAVAAPVAVGVYALLKNRKSSQMRAVA